MSFEFKRKRQPNTTREGHSWSYEVKVAIWNKGGVAIGYDPQLYKIDRCGFLMNWFDYGNRNSQNGWEIDHINPVANNGGDEINNLQPLNWLNNARKGDSLVWKCGD